MSTKTEARSAPRVPYVDPPPPAITERAPGEREGDRIRADFLASAVPLVRRLAELGRAAYDALRTATSAGDTSLTLVAPDDRFRWAGTVAAERGLIRPRRDAWLALADEARRAVHLAEAAERRAWEDHAVAQASSWPGDQSLAARLARVPRDRLVEDARDLLRAGDARGAATRVEALRVARVPGAFFADLSSDVEDALDATQEERVAATEARNAELAAASRARRAAETATALADRLSRDVDGDFPALEREALAWVREHEPEARR